MTDDTSRKLTGYENIVGLENGKILDFWSWAYSNLLVNTVRPIFAEYIVAAALGITDKPRVEWEGFDLEYRGKYIEVKASSYLQGWHQIQPSKIIFDIAKRKQLWESSTNKTTLFDAPTRFAGCYVFCVYAEKDKLNFSLLNLSFWDFYVVSTEQINEAFGDQKTAGLNSIQRLSHLVRYEVLSETVERVLDFQ